MKKPVLILWLLLMMQFCFTQNIERCSNIVDLTAQALNSKTTAGLNQHLAKDFEIAGQKGDIAIAVLTQLFGQFRDSVKAYSKTNTITSSGQLTMQYEMDYAKMGSKTATFIFDAQNKLKNLELFKMEVKTLGNKEPSVSKPEKSIITVPFSMIGNIIAVEAKLNGDKRTFLLDTGSPKVILNSSYIPKSNTSKESITSSKGIGGTISGMDIQTVDKLEFNGIVIQNEEVITLDLTHLENDLETEIEIHGLIGYDLIKDYDLVYDYKNRVLQLVDPDAYDRYYSEQLSPKKSTTIPFEIKNHIPVFKAEIDSKVYSFGLDSGAETNLMDDDLLPEISKNLKDRHKSSLTGADKAVLKVTKGSIKKMVIGGKQFVDMKTLFNDISHLNEGYKLQLDGLMGYEFLSKQKTVVSYRRKEIVLLD